MIFQDILTLVKGHSLLNAMILIDVFLMAFGWIINHPKIKDGLHPGVFILTGILLFSVSSFILILSTLALSK